MSYGQECSRRLIHPGGNSGISKIPTCPKSGPKAAGMAHRELCQGSIRGGFSLKQVIVPPQDTISEGKGRHWGRRLSLGGHLQWDLPLAQGPGPSSVPLTAGWERDGGTPAKSDCRLQRGGFILGKSSTKACGYLGLASSCNPETERGLRGGHFPSESTKPSGERM